MKISLVRRRVLFFFGIIIVSLLSIVMRLIFLQFINKKKYIKLSQSNRYRINYILPQRGNFLDKDNIFITNRVFVKILIIKFKKQYPTSYYIDALKKLTQIIDVKLDFKSIKKKIIKNKNDNRFKMTIKNHLNQQEIEKISFNYNKIDPIELIDNEFRFYKTGKSMFHIIGYVAIPTEKDIKDLGLNPNYVMNDSYRMGKIGLEKIFNNSLEGEYGIKISEVDARNNVVNSFTKKEPKKGSDVQLTISLKLQNYLETKMEGKTGCVIVNDISTGNIIGIISSPSVDPNKINIFEYQNREDFTSFNFINRSLNATYTPGSSFKMLSALAMLENNIIDINTTVNCTGKFKIGSLVKSCWKKTGHGNVNIIDAISQSCNCFFYKTGMNLSIKQLNEMCKVFSLDKNEDFLLNNKNNIIPDEKWKKKHYREKWYLGDTLNAIIGHGFIGFTPIKLLSYINAIATGRIVNYNIIASSDLGSSEYRNLDIKKENLDIIKQGLIKSSSDGLMRGLKYYGNKKIKLVGKTGTSQRISKAAMERLNKNTVLKKKLNHDAVFVGYAPFDEPKYAIVTVIENGLSGFNSAVLSNQIMKFIQENDI